MQVLISKPAGSAESFQFIPIISDTLKGSFGAPPFKEQSSPFPDTQFIHLIDSVFIKTTTLKSALHKFNALLPIAEKKGLTGQLFSSFYEYKKLNKIDTVSINYLWYCKKWRTAALKATNDFLRMCYSDCFYETMKIGPIATPIMEINQCNYKHSDSISIGLFLRDTTVEERYTVEISRLKWQNGYSQPGFEPFVNTKNKGSKQHWFTSYKIPSAGIYRCIVYTSNNYRAFYFSIDDTLQPLTLADNRSLLV
jgi:hypothetical protein